MRAIKKYLDKPYRLKNAILSGVELKVGVFYDFFMKIVEFIVLQSYLLTCFLVKNSNPKCKEKELVIVCRNKFFSDKNSTQVSTEKFMLDYTLKDVKVNFEVFYWDCERWIGYQLAFYQLIMKKRPSAIIFSSYIPDRFTHPSLYLLKKIKKNIDVKYISILWDTCHNSFMGTIRAQIPIFNQFIVNENPLMVMDLNYKGLSNDEKSKFTFRWTPLDFKRYELSVKNIDVSFLGQISAYRSYRRDFMINLMRSNIAGFYSAFERSNQLEHKEYFEILSRSKIGINFSYSVDRHQLKGRVFDTMLSGALLMESKNNQIEQLFIDGVDYVSFSSIEDLLVKIKFYLSNKEDREMIANNGRKKCIERYNCSAYWKGVV